MLSTSVRNPGEWCSEPDVQAHSQIPRGRSALGPQMGRFGPPKPHYHKCVWPTPQQNKCQTRLAQLACVQHTVHNG
eukprot:11208014-Lingulodinium_polyedra.AAC.1